MSAFLPASGVFLSCATTTLHDFELQCLVGGEHTRISRKFWWQIFSNGQLMHVDAVLRPEFIMNYKLWVTASAGLAIGAAMLWLRQLRCFRQVIAGFVVLALASVVFASAPWMFA